MRKGAIVSACGSYRYCLTREWGPIDAVLRQVCWVMLNPSTADHERDDPTILRCINFSQRWGFNSLVVVNLFPERTSNPKECYRRSSCQHPDVRARNVNAIRAALETSQLIVAAWGAADWYQPYAKQFAASFWDLYHFYCLGTTQSGAPKHPLARGVNRVPDDREPTLWGPP